LGVKLLRGRDFTQADCENKDARRVAIIDEEMATKLFPNEDAVGQHIRYTQPPKDGAPNDLEIVGVVSKHRHSVDNETLTRRLVASPCCSPWSAFMALRRAPWLAGHGRSVFGWLSAPIAAMFSP